MLAFTPSNEASEDGLTGCGDTDSPRLLLPSLGTVLISSFGCCVLGMALEADEEGQEDELEVKDEVCTDEGHPHWDKVEL